MKKIMFSLMLMMAAFVSANAMSFERAQAEALYLTDKMAYELNLNDQQYNDAYEINLDYFLRVDSPSDIYGSYYSYRLSDLRCILYDWQYNLLTAADYFLRPIIWRAGGWYFPIYSYYNRGYFYYSRPVVWRTYYGGHSRYYHHGGYYADRRPHWNGGMRGHDMHHPSMGHGGGNGGRRISGNGYHIDINGHRGGAGGGRVGNHYGAGNRHDNDGSHSGNSHSGSTGYDGHHSGSSHSGSGYGNRGDMGHVRSNYGSSNSSSSVASGGTSGRSSFRSSGASSSRGNSFDGSSSRMSGSSRMGGSSRGGASFGGSRGGSSMSGSRSSSPSMSGSSRGGGMSHSTGMSRGGGGVSRSGRR